MLPTAITLPTNNCKSYFLPRAVCGLCYNNYFLLHNECVPCPKSQADEAKLYYFTYCECDGATNFRNCAPGGTKSCKIGYYLQDSLCYPCSPLCASCEGPEKCVSFIVGDDQYNEKNVQTSDPAAIIEILKAIVKCPQFCAHCANSVCDRCASGYYLDEAENCLKCGVLNCQYCNADGTCALCRPNFHLSEERDRCFICADYNCMRCEFASGGCSVCRFGYILYSNGNCAPSKIDGCLHVLDLGFGYQSCGLCAHGYMKSLEVDDDGYGALCYKCSPGCKRCSVSDSCDECRPGWFLRLDKCVYCAEPNCLVCVDPGVCLLSTDSLAVMFGLDASTCMNTNFQEYPRYAITERQLLAHTMNYMSTSCSSCNLQGALELGCKTCASGSLNRVGDCVYSIDQDQKVIDEYSKLPGWATALIVISAVLLCVGLAVLTVCIVLRRKKTTKVHFAPREKIENTARPVIPPVNITVR